MNSLIAMAVVIFLVVLLFSGKMYLYSYEMDDVGIDINIFGHIKFIQIKYENIESVKIRDWWQLGAAGVVPLIFRSRFSTKFVVVRKTDGIFRFVILTPEHPDEFIRFVMSRSRRPRALSGDRI